MNALLDTVPMQNVVLPPGLAPPTPLSSSAGVSEFHLLDDKQTGVLALGSFSDADFDALEKTLLTGLQDLKAAGATRLIIDVVSICYTS